MMQTTNTVSRFTAMASLGLCACSTASWATFEGDPDLALADPVPPASDPGDPPVEHAGAPVLPPRAEPTHVRRSTITPPDTRPTLREHVAATPSWYGRDRRVVPQVPAADALFDSVDTRTGPLPESGLLLCELHAGTSPSVGLDGRPRWDAYGFFGRFVAPDMTAALSLDGDRVIAHGQEDRYNTVVSVPGVTLRPGTVVGAHVWDRDAAFHDFMGRGRGRVPQEQPLHLQLQYVSVDCRMLPTHEVERQLLPVWLSADRALTGLEAGLHPDPTADDFAFPEERAGAARTSLREAASLTGWADPRVVERDERLTAVRTRWTVEVTAMLREIAAESPVPGTPVPMEGLGAVSLSELTCRPAPVRALRHQAPGARCVARRVVAPSDNEPEPVLQARLIRWDGTAVPATAVLADRGRAGSADEPARDAELVYVIGLREPVGAEDAPGLLMIRHGGESTLLRLR